MVFGKSAKDYKQMSCHHYNKIYINALATIERLIDESARMGNTSLELTDDDYYRELGIEKTNFMTRLKLRDDLVKSLTNRGFIVISRGAHNDRPTIKEIKWGV